MDDRTFRRLFCETPRQTRIRHNWPLLNHQMTKAEREQHERLMQELRADQGAREVPHDYPR